MNLISLRPNRELLDSKFDGYKLSLEPIPLYSTKLDAGINVASISDDQYSYQHVRMLSLHNHLQNDPWNPGNFYFVTQGMHIIHGKSLKGQPPQINLVCTLPSSYQIGNYNVSICFPSFDFIVISDGGGKLYFVNSFRKPNEFWELASCEVFDNEKPMSLLNAVTWRKDEKQIISCMCMNVEDVRKYSEYKNNTFKDNALFLNILEWLTFTQEKSTWKLETRYKLATSGNVEYAAIEPFGTGFVIACENNFQLLETPTSQNKCNEKQSLYFWIQSDDDVTVWFRIDDKICKSDVIVDISSSFISIKLCEKSLLEGVLGGTVITNDSTWTILDNKLEITLSKMQQNCSWSSFIQNNAQGQELLDPNLIDMAHEQLSYLTSESLELCSSDHAFNTQQLEECDTCSTDTFYMFRFDSSTLKITHKISLAAHQWLFNVSLAANNVPAVCIRHDVDGIIWQPEYVKDTLPSWNCYHVGTLHAFGYVQAGKEQKKFSVCSEDLRFAIISDVKRHVYVYYQPMPLNSMLTNRKTGTRVKHISTQKVINLDNNTEEILGVQITSEGLCILTCNHLYLAEV